MKRIEKAQFLLCVALLWFAQSVFASSNSNPGLYYGQIPTAGQWNSYFSSKLDYLPGTLNSVPYWDASGNFLYAPVSGDCTTAANVFTCNATSAVVATRALNLSGGAGGSIPYQSGVNSTAMLANGTAGYVLTSNGGTAAPSWNISPISGFAYADASGVDAITASYTVSNGVLADGYDLTVGIVSPNVTTTPTFAPTLNGSLQTARTIVKFVGNVQVPLVAGDLQGDVWLKYDSIGLKWVLQNPGTMSYTNLSAASGVTASAVSVTNNLTAGGTISATGGLLNTAASKLPTVTATVAANAMTVNVSSMPLDFRSATSASGVPSTILAAPAALIIPASATLGTVSGNTEHVVVLELNNAGTAELAVVNLSGGVDLDEEDGISTTAISAGSTANNVVYSTTSRTNVPYRVVGSLEVTEATAGTWATAPANIAGVGAGNTYMSMQSVGYGQTWQSFTSVTRAVQTLYYNTTNRPIVVMFSITGGANAVFQVNGVTVIPAQTSNVSGTVIVPPGASYILNSASTWGSWVELR